MEMILTETDLDKIELRGVQLQIKMREHVISLYPDSKLMTASLDVLLEREQELTEKLNPTTVL